MFSQGALASTGSCTHGAQAAVPASRTSSSTKAAGRNGDRRLGDALERAAPAGGGHLQDAREDHAGLRQPAEEQEVDQQRLPRPDAVEHEAGQEGNASEGRHAEQEPPHAGRQKRVPPAGDASETPFTVTPPAVAAPGSPACPGSGRAPSAPSTLNASPKRGMLRPPSRMML